MKVVFIVTNAVVINQN